MKRFGIVGAGDSFPAAEEMRRILAHVDVVIAADGGYDALQPLGISPDVLLGDMDSMRLSSKGDVLSEEMAGEILRYPVKKDATDMELALLYAQRHGATSAIILGGTGSRLDHTVGNLSLVERFTKEGLPVILRTAHNRISYLTAGEYQLPVMPEGWYTSFLALSGEVRLTLRGFEYPLEDTPIRSGTTLSLSNHVVAADNLVRVSGEAEGLFCFQSRDAET